MEQTTSTPPRPGRWIGGPLFDLCFFFGGALLAVAAGLAALTVPSLIVPMWFLWLLLLDGPHLLATWQRTYLDRQTRAERPRLLWGSLLWLLPAPLVLVASWTTERPDAFVLLLGAAAIWSFHHAIRQHHGILAIYQRLCSADAAARRTDARLLHVTLWLALALFLLAHPANRELIGLPRDAGQVVGALVTVLGIALAAAIFTWIVLLLGRRRRGSAIKPGLFALVAAVGATLFGLFAVGMQEPLLAQAVQPEHVFMAATIVTGVLHSVQYMGIVAVTDARRRKVSWQGVLRLYGVLVLVSLLYVGINLLRGASPVASPVEADSHTAQAFLAIYWGLFFQHYWLDQKIWKPSTDARLRTELGMVPA